MMAIVIAGVIACLVMDGFQRLLWVTLGQPPSNWAVVGRWAFIVLRSARLYQPDIETAPEAPHERAFGWFVHYAVGVGYAVIYASLMQYGLLTASLVDGLIFGIASVIVPYFFFLPVMGKGMLGKHTPAPLKVCMLALVNHCIFGVGMAAGFQLAV